MSRFAQVFLTAGAEVDGKRKWARLTDGAVRWVGNEEMLSLDQFNPEMRSSFSGPGGYLKIQLYRKENFIVVAEIEDHGVRMDEDVQKRILINLSGRSLPFERRQLGLAVVWILELCKESHVSEPGVGARFCHLASGYGTPMALEAVGLAAALYILSFHSPSCF